tara:strand:- start:58 stop:282 length:225 start_codon:yes stop_codon:yes gene_type:complete
MLFNQSDKKSSIELKRTSSEFKRDNVPAKYFIDYLLSEQKKRDVEISKLKKTIDALKKELETYTQFMNDNMGYR